MLEPFSRLFNYASTSASEIVALSMLVLSALTLMFPAGFQLGARLGLQRHRKKAG